MQTQCSFAGAWGGGHAPKAFYVSSYFWDRAIEAGQPHFKQCTGSNDKSRDQ